MYRLINKKKKGFTLVEILVSVVIIGILATALIPKVSAETNKAKEAGIDTDFRSFYTGIKAITTLNGVEEYNTKEKLEVLLNKNLEPQLRFSNGLSAQKDPWEKPYELYSETLEDENTYIVIASKGNDKRDGFIFEPERTDNNLRRVAKVCDDHKYFLAIGMTPSGKTVGKITNEQIFKVVHEGEEWTGTNDNGGTTGGTTGDGGTTEGLVIEQIENLIANLESLDGVSEIQNMINEIADETEQARLQNLLDNKIEELGTVGTGGDWMDPEYLDTLPPIVAGATAVQDSVGPNGEYVPTGYVLAKDEDFGTVVFNGENRWRYEGNATKVVVPHKINNEDVTSCIKMFQGDSFATYASVEAVASNNLNITNTQYMFENSVAEEIDLTYFDSSNVINTSDMFTQAKAIEIKVTSLDVSKVKEMNGMFGYTTNLTVLDISNFDLSSVTYLSGMLSNTGAETVYVKSQGDIDILMADEYNPTSINYVVKTPGAGD